MNRVRQKEQISFSSLTWNIVRVFLVIFAAFLAVNMAANYFIKRQTKMSIRSAAHAYITQLDGTFEEINDYLANLAIIDGDVENVKYTRDSMTFIRSSQKVNEKLDFFHENVKGNFRYFVYYPQLDYYNASDRGELGILESSKLNQKMRELIEEDYAARGCSVTREWQMVQVEGVWYAVNYVFHENCYACCFILAEDLAESLNMIELGESSYLVFLSEDFAPYNHKTELEAEGFYREGAENRKLKQEYFSYRHAVINTKPEYAAFFVDLIVRNQKDIIMSFLMQTVIVAILFLGVMLWICMGVYTRNQLLRPISFFFQNLGKIEQDEEELYFENSRILELQEANNLYKKILEQVKQLKIQVYEKTIEQQRTRIEYMQLQIQPHFYINCMNLIYNMSCMGDEEGVQMMAKHVSDYFRYIFKCNTDDVELQQELEHVENYLEICKLRYRKKLDYRIENGQNLKGVRVPPLLLYTFVENSVKYGCKAEGVSGIYVRTRLEEEADSRFVIIEITDEGEGFAREVLEQLSGGGEIVTDKGTRIGITNAMKRMEYIYGENFRITFCNREEGGATVRMRIPVQEEKCEHTCDG